MWFHIYLKELMVICHAFLVYKTCLACMFFCWCRPVKWTLLSCCVACTDCPHRGAAPGVSVIMSVLMFLDYKLACICCIWEKKVSCTHLLSLMYFRNTLTSACYSVRPIISCCTQASFQRGSMDTFYYLCGTLVFVTGELPSFEELPSPAFI